MPWGETCAIDERIRLIALWNEQKTSVSELAREFGISRKTVYKWVDRYELFGSAGLEDRTTVAHHHPHATAEAVVSAFVELRKERPTWGPNRMTPGAPTSRALRARDKSRCHPLTITDQVSRYLLKCESVKRPDTEHAKVHFERAFREYGLPLRIRSDNGLPFATAGIGGLSELSVWWMKLGIHPERIEPGHPEQNGRHERMHRTLGRRNRPAATPERQ